MVPNAGEGMTYRQKMDRIKHMPKLSRIILILKVMSAAFFAIGLEGLVAWSQPGRPLVAVTFFALGVVVQFVPIQAKINVCAPVRGRRDARTDHEAGPWQASGSPPSPRGPMP